MDILFGKATTHIRRKVNELILALNTSVTNIIKVGEVVAATGSIITDAAPLSATKFIHNVTGVDATKAVVLPVGTPGSVHIVYNKTANALPIFPASGQKINSGTASAAITSAANKQTTLTYADDTIGWTTTAATIA